MSATARLSLPYIAPQQAQKQVTYNAAMAALDQLVQPAVKSRTSAAPPGSPAEGDTYIVAPSGTGAWSGKDNRFACWLSGAWSFGSPADGWLAYVLDTAELAVFAAGAWSGFVSNGGSSVAKFGINTTADLTNRLAVASGASLFTHAGTDHRLTINKAAAGNIASLLLEDAFSARAEFGLTGDDALHVKVSPNGSTWFEALNVAQASGLVTLPQGQLAFPATANPSSNANTLDDYREGTFTPTILFGGASTGVGYLGSGSTAGRYTRIGRTVFAQGQINLTSKGSSTGAAQIGGLPFTSVNDGTYNSATIGFAANFTGVTGALGGLVAANTSRINLYFSNNGNATGMTDGNFTNTAAVYFLAAYDAQ